MLAQGKGRVAEERRKKVVGLKMWYLPGKATSPDVFGEILHK